MFLNLAGCPCGRPAKKWNFSPETCQVILHYKDPLDNDKPDSEIEEKTAIVQLSDLIAHAAGVGSPEGYLLPRRPESRVVS